MGRLQIASLGPGVVLGPNGAPVAGVTGQINVHAESTPVTIWSDETGGTSDTGGAFQSDDQGHIPGWIDSVAFPKIDIIVPSAETISLDLGLSSDTSLDELPTDANVDFGGHRLANVGNSTTGSDALNQATGDARYDATGAAAAVRPTIGQAITGATHSALLTADPNGDLISGPATASVGFGAGGNPNTAGVFNPLHPTYGAVADCKTVTDGVIATGNKFSTTLGALTILDVGKTVCCVAAGTATIPFTATISSVAAGVGTLSASATNNGTGLTVWYGTDNTTVLQSVVNAASACAITATGGGTVDLGSAGAYLTQTLVPASNVTLKSEGAALIKHPASTDGIISNRTGLAAFSNFRVVGVRFIGEGLTAGDTTITTTDRRGAIGVYNGTNVLVRDCVASGFAFQGFAFINVAGVRVLDNTLSNVCSATLGNAIHITTTVAPTANQDVLVTGNTVTGCATAACCIQSQHTDTTPFPYQARVHHNNFTTSAFACIALEIGSSPSANLTIRRVQIDHNICTQTATAGTGTYGITVSDNSGSSYSTDPNEFMSISIDHNDIVSSDSGILCEASQAMVDHNTVQAATQGILMEGNSANTPVQQMVDSNIVSMTAGSSHGIFATGVNYVTIQGNRIYWPSSVTSTTAVGIDLLTVGWPTVKNNVVEYAPAHGMVFSSVNDIVCDGNRVYNASAGGSHVGNGIQWISGSTLGAANWITRNTIVDDRATTLTNVAINNSTAGSGRLHINDNYLFFPNANAVIGGTAPVEQARNISNAASYPAAPAAITVTASPFSYVNSFPYAVSVLVSGGTVSAITITQATINLSTGVTAGMFRLDPGNTLIVTYSVLPTMDTVPLRT